MCIYVYIYLAVLTGEGRNFIAPTAITCRLYTMECIYYGVCIHVCIYEYIYAARGILPANVGNIHRYIAITCRAVESTAKTI